MYLSESKHVARTGLSPDLMETPPPPRIGNEKRGLHLNRTAKTPLQQAFQNAIARDFRSECQPRISSRFVQDTRTNKPANQTPADRVRNHLNTCAKPASQTPGDRVRLRLNTCVKPGKSVIASTSSSSVAPTSTLTTSTNASRAAPTPAPPSNPASNPAPLPKPAFSLRDKLLEKKQNAPVISAQSSYVPTQIHLLQTKHEPIPVPGLLSRSNAHIQTNKREREHVGPEKILPHHTPFTPKQLPIDSDNVQPLRPHLIQDTRVGLFNRPGPIATATKAPFSVSQYSQPTPLSNKSAQQVSRAQSEPSIKYTVKVNDKTYKILRKLGSGGSAKVYEGFEPSTYQSVAIKIINVANADPRTRESYFNEKLILSQLKDSKHVVKIYNSEYKSECNELVIVMEKGDADLSQVLDHNFKSRDNPGVIDGIFIKFYWRGMLQAVNEIHQHGIVHADLKPVNFILVKNHIKLIDFGIATSLEPEGTSIIKDYQIGTINYMAPESLRNRSLEDSFVAKNHNLFNSTHHNQSDNFHDENEKRLLKTPRSRRTVIKYNSKADIWSLGCILYNFVYGRPPFDKYPDIISKVQAITDPRHVIDFPEINNAHLLECLKLCLRYYPEERPSAEELLNHEYLKDDILIVRHKQHQHRQ